MPRKSLLAVLLLTWTAVGVASYAAGRLSRDHAPVMDVKAEAPESLAPQKTAAEPTGPRPVGTAYAE